MERGAWKVREDYEKMGHQKRADVVRMPEWGMRAHGGAAHLDDRKALGQRPPAPELVVPILALERLVVRPERGRGELGRAVVRHAVVLRCDGVEHLLRVLRRPRRLDRRAALGRLLLRRTALAALLVSK